MRGDFNKHCWRSPRSAAYSWYLATRHQERVCSLKVERAG